MSKKFVNVYGDETITRYFKDVKKTKRLTPEEEKELALRIQDGDKDAIGELVNANLRFVISKPRITTERFN
jgi:RNA polymerase primary sigma factor